MSARGKSMLLIGVVAALAVWGLLRLRFQTEIGALFPENIKETRGLSLFLRNFSHPGELWLVLKGGEEKELRDAADAVEKALAQRPDLARRVIARSPWEEHPEQMTDFFAFTLLNLPEDRLKALQERLAPDKIQKSLAATLEDLQNSLTLTEGLAGYDPLGLAALVMQERSRGFGTFDSFSTPDKSLRLMVVEAPSPDAGYREKARWIGELRAAVKSALEPVAGGKITAGFSGEPAFVAEISTGMERDMRGSATGTLVLSALFFWLMYRSLRPLIFITLCMGVIVALTLALCGLAIGELTVFTAGFASILIGLAIDYGMLVYQESGRGKLIGADLRQRTRWGIFGAAGTTSIAFLALLASSLPGLRELGFLLGAGILIGALVMLEIFSRCLRTERENPAAAERHWLPAGLRRALPVVTAAICLTSACGILLRGLPRLDTSPKPLRPRDCEAQRVMDELLHKMSGSETAMSLLIHGRSEEDVGAELAQLAAILDPAREKGIVERYALPITVWPEAAKQRQNLTGPAMALARDAARLKAAVSEAGFEDSAFVLADGVFSCWKRWAEKGKFPLWPDSEGSQWTVSRYLNHDTDGAVFCMGILQTPKTSEASAFVRELQSREKTYILGDGLILQALGARLPVETMRILTALGIGVLAMLAITFRAVKPILQCLGVLCLNLLALLGAMAWFGWNWNLINLAGLLLCLGTGVDYSIHVLLKLRSNGGDADEMQATTGRALLLCALTSVVGFGSLSWASNDGLASLGRICATALLLNLLISLFLLPRLASRKPLAATPQP